MRWLFPLRSARKAVLRLVTVTGCALGSLAFVAVAPGLLPTFGLAADRLEVRHYRFSTAVPRAIEVGFFSDLHAGVALTPGDLARIRDGFADNGPECILVGGDIVDAEARQVAEVLDLFDALGRIAPVVAVFGNHDLHSGEASELARTLAAHGVSVLRDDLWRLPAGGLTVLGTGDYESEGGARTAFHRLAGGEKVLLLTHDPAVLPELSDHERERTLLALVGHTHGGQIRLPLIGPLINRGERRFQPGLAPGGGGLPPLLLTAGVGYAVVGVRINCPPEIVILELMPSAR
jgi:uncharacterized protein